MQSNHADHGLDHTGSEEQRLHTFMSAQTIADLGHIDLNDLRPHWRHRRTSYDVVLPWSEDPRDLAPSHSYLALSRTPTTPSLRAESLATARTDTPRPERLQDLNFNQVPSTDHGIEMHPMISLDAVSERAMLAQIGGDSTVPELDHDIAELALSGTGQRDYSVESMVGSGEGSDQGSLLTVGTCPGVRHPSTIPGGFGSKHPPLNIFVQIPDQDECEGFKALQDTGCNVNVMKEEIWRRLGQPRLHRSECRTIHGLAGRVDVLGRIKLCFRIDGYGDSPFKTVFEVVPDRCVGVDALLCGMFIERLPPRI